MPKRKTRHYTPRERTTIRLTGTVQATQAGLSHSTAFALHWAQAWLSRAGSKKVPTGGLIRRALEVYVQHLEVCTDHRWEVVAVHRACTAIKPAEGSSLKGEAMAAGRDAALKKARAEVVREQKAAERERLKQEKAAKREREKAERQKAARAEKRAKRKVERLAATGEQVARPERLVVCAESPPWEADEGDDESHMWD